VKDTIERIGQRWAAKRQPRRQQLVQHNSQGKQVHAVVDCVRAQLLGRHIGNRAEHHAW